MAAGACRYTHFLWRVDIEISIVEVRSLRETDLQSSEYMHSSFVNVYGSF